MNDTLYEITLPAELTPEWVARIHRQATARIASEGVRLDCAKLKKLGSLGRGCLAQWSRTASESGTRLVLTGVPGGLREDLETLQDLAAAKGETRPADPSLIRLGEWMSGGIQGLIHVSVLLVESLHGSTLGLFTKKTILKGSTTAQMVGLGSSSLPIVLLLSFLIGLTLAIQSAVQLEKFGASLYIASGIGISMVTEIGPMMTAVIIAGRSGSSITAEISTMVVQEELRALNSMGIQPIQFLVLPRFWALSITLPLLTVCADIIGIFAGFLVAYFYADIPTHLFLGELEWGVTFTMVWQSMVKVVVFAWIITLVSTYKGLVVRGGADAVGRATTSCVVTCIFCIILADAIFSFLFYF